MKPLNYLAATAALSMATAPAIAVGNPASSLSIAPSARVATSIGNQENLEGASGMYVAVGALLVVLVTIFIVVDREDNPKSP